MKLNRRNKFLLFGFILMLFVSYHFAISNTIDLYKSYISKENIIADNNLNSNAATALLKREKELDAQLSKYSIKTSVSFQNELLQKLNEYSTNYNLKITDFQEPHISRTDLATTSTYRFSISGSFNGCLQVLNKIENNAMLGTVYHVSFVKKKNYKTNIDELTTEVFLQRVQGK